MPIYEYQCEDCGERTEAIQRMSDPPLVECPECEGTLRKLISAPAFQFKGSGWYVTDYARASGGDKDGSQAGAEGGSSAEAKESKESKGAAADSAGTAGAKASKTEGKSDSPKASKVAADAS